MLYSKILGFVMKGRIRKRSDFHEAFIWEVKCWQFMKSQKNTGRHCLVVKREKVGGNLFCNRGSWYSFFFCNRTNQSFNH